MATWLKTVTAQPFLEKVCRCLSWETLVLGGYTTGEGGSSVCRAPCLGWAPLRGPCPCVLYKLPWQGFLLFSPVLLALFPHFCSCLRGVEAGRGEGWRLGEREAFTPL